MGMTMTQKILAAHAGLDQRNGGSADRGETWIWCWANDITGPGRHPRDWRRRASIRCSDKTKIALVMDHFTPNKDIKSAEQCLECREFCQEVRHRKFLRRWRNGHRARAAAGKGSDRSR